MIIIPILSMAGYASLLTLLLRTSFTLALPAATALLISILYISALAGSLQDITYLMYGSGIIFLGFCLIIDKDIRFKLKQYRGEIIVLSLIILLFYFYTRHAAFSSWDDFSFWGIITKELLAQGVFENQSLPTSILKIHAHYPRGSAVYHYFMLLDSGYSEGRALFAHFILHLIFLSPLMANKKYWQTLVLIFAILCIAVLYTTSLRSTYNDSTIALMFGSIFAIYILEPVKTKAIMLLLPIAFMMPLFREIGLWLATFAAIILIIGYIRAHKFNNMVMLFLFALLLVLPFLSSFIWLDYFKSTHDFFGRTSHSFENLNLILSSFNDQHKLLLFSYLKAFLTFLIKEGSIGIYIMIALAIYSVNKYAPALTYEYKFYLLSLASCFIIFSIWRLYLYFFTFSYAEAIKGASLLRYLGTYTISFSIISAVYIKQSIFKCPLTRKETLFFGALFTISFLTVTSNIYRIPYKISPAEAAFNRQSAIITKLLSNNLEVDIDFTNKNGTFDCYKLNYALAPYFGTKFKDACFSAPSTYIEGKKDLQGVIPDEIKQVLSSHTQRTKVRILYSPFINKIEVRP